MIQHAPVRRIDELVFKVVGHALVTRALPNQHCWQPTIASRESSEVANDVDFTLSESARL